MEGHLTFLEIMILAILGLPYSQVCGSSRPGNSFIKPKHNPDCLSTFGDVDDQKAPHLRFTGGYIEDHERYPFMVGVYHFDNLLCAGSILNKYWILTAASCVEMTEMFTTSIVVPDKKNEISYAVDYTLKHDDYIEGERVDNNIGLLKVVDAMTFTSGHYRPAKLPKPNQEIPIGSVVTALGWSEISHGKNKPRDIKMKMLNVVNIPKWTNSILVEFYDKWWTRSRDIGGPVVWKDTLVGIISYEENELKPNKAFIFPKVSSYLDWIYDNIEED